ncbi:hypothetical protein BEN47_08950 [Hymenobacter lapidarius]|uniref:Secretion system C-terminal sorting domain-containing protein n=2 Tax=Hymenobacter lapidarius TaxID=1908237 RepID=A0A1G1TC53_9BACT|nr:hypothetical protein BEN47_08950 [Hymenobacter lapidarius]
MAGLLLLGTQAAQAQTVYGLLSATPTTQSLVTFSATAPGTFTGTLPIAGLTAGQTLVGLDSRPNTGQLFALGYNPTGTVSQLYILNPTTGVLTAVGAALTTVNLGTTTNRIGFDFNPTVDRIRVTGNNNNNYRLNPNNGAVAATDLPLNYNPGNATSTPVVPADANAGQTPVIGSVAYANSFIGATNTVLYDIDEAKSLYTTQNPPNDGVLNSRMTLSVSTATALATDLDIYFNPTTRANNAYLTIATGTAAAPATQLYTLDFITGANLTAVGAIGPVGTLVTDIAFAIDRPAMLPAITGNLAYALAGTNLLTFDTAQPTLIRTSVGLSGIPADQTLVGVDVRPANNVLYGLGYRLADQMAQLYTLNATTGAATAVGTPVMLPLGTTAADAIGFDFNPTVDRIRVVGSNRTNFRLNPNDGAIAATDLQIKYNPGNATSTPVVPADVNAAATPAVGTVAYTNSFMGANATSGTTLYAYDRGLNVLATQIPPNDGVLNTIGSSGLTLNATPSVSLDIYSTAVGTNTAYLVANSAASANSSLYTLNLATGATTLVGAIGNGLVARDIAVAAAMGVVTGVRERADLASGLMVYPNPARSNPSVAFSLVRAGRVELSVFDAMGRRVATQTSSNLSVGAQTLRLTTGILKAGLYTVRLTVNGQTAASRQLVIE